jgi:2-polyprenyl-3-methyl-5-hydroxy-6-metoxy-1,4-benzoquinol methylase/Flp pilus assembly protein TadD
MAGLFRRKRFATMNPMTENTLVDQSTLSYEQQVDIARMLITANDLYQSTLDPQLALAEKKKALSLARVLTTNALNVQADNEQALNLLGRIELDRGKTEVAAKRLDSAIAINPNNSQFYINRAYVSLANKQFDEAESFFLKALKIENNSAQAYSGIAYVHLRKGDYLGAFKRYQSLVSKGYVNAFIKQNILEAIDHLQADTYQASLEASLLEYYCWEAVDHTKLGRMTSSLIVQKYQLHDDSAIIDMDSLVTDPLLHCLLTQGGMYNHDIETLITSLRQHILFEAIQTKNLRDELIPITLSLGIYSARSDYALFMNEDEQSWILDLKQEINSATTSPHWQKEEIIGACLLISMYESLYNQSFSFKLMKFEVDEYPIATQQVMQLALYDVAEEHLLSFNIFGDNIQNIVNIEFKRPWPRWNNIPQHNNANYIDALQAEIGHYPAVDAMAERPLQMLVYGCGSGLRAITMACYFENLSITAVDEDRDNLLFAQRKADELGLTNIKFDHTENLMRNSQQPFDIIECTEKINYIESVENAIQRLLCKLTERGLLRLSLLNEKNRAPFKQIRTLIEERSLAATTDNIRHLRHAIIAEAKGGFWDNILQDEAFFSTGGVKQMLFNRHEHHFNLTKIQNMAKNLKLKCLGFVDLPVEQIKQVNQPEKFAYIDLKKLDESLFDDTFEVYFTQR